jgi:hypothetical protein
MAIGFLSKKKGTDAQTTSSMSSNEKTVLEKNDPELGTIGEPRSDDSSDNSISVGKQMEMEAENAIKYRTCSWQKVCEANCAQLPVHANSLDRRQHSCSPSTSVWR